MPDGKDDSQTAKIDSTSPFYLGSQDRPGDFITSTRLKLNNFDDWAHSIRVALRARRKFGFLNGTIKTSVPPCIQDDWETIHIMLLSWLMNTIDPEVKSLLSNYEDVKKLWDDIHERFSIVNRLRKLSQLWDELDKYKSLISCPYTKCECDVGKKHADRRDSNRLHQFLLDLQGNVYGHNRSVLLSQDPLPTLNRVFHAITQEERVHGMDHSKDVAVEVSGFANRSSSRPAARSTTYLFKAERKALFCSHCHKHGHDMSMCFDLLDEFLNWCYELKGAKPPGKVGRGRGNARGQSTSSIRANVVDVPTTSGDASADSVTIYSTPSHKFSGVDTQI
ncbi:hypothetical protein RND81_10G054100 [Saponaria officinalis]|uniref:Retrotransposon Copia-like N-terminal domain-containing protein n=1 Tax=Saponaria officinalis TaxID=3572 RepID=A0AAW1HY86_SAPOF